MKKTRKVRCFLKILTTPQSISRPRSENATFAWQLDNSEVSTLSEEWLGISRC